MPQEILRQIAFHAGELDPKLQSRRDLKAYSAGLARCENLLALPQGPLTRRPGTVFVDRIRRPLQAVPIPGDATLTAVNGGDATKAKAVGDGALLTTADMVATDPYVILEIDFGAPVTVGCVDLIDYAAVAFGGGGTAEPPPTGGWSPPGGGGGLDNPEHGGVEAF